MLEVLQKCRRSKLEVEMKSAGSAKRGHVSVNLGRVSNFSQPPTLISDIFAAPWPKSIFTTSLERSNVYLFVQGHSMTFKLYNLGSEWPHLIYIAYVLSVCNNKGSNIVDMNYGNGFPFCKVVVCQTFRVCYISLSYKRHLYF